MSLFAIADLHLSLGGDKPMDIFKGWSDYVQRLSQSWEAIVKDSDTVVIAGDISWAMKLSDTYTDFDFINSLPGRKILIKGNHDYWWETMNKMSNYLACNNFETLNILFNNSFECDEYAVCGTRGWLIDSSKDEDTLVLNREIGRLRASLERSLSFKKEPVVFLHYPPICTDAVCEGLISLMQEYGVKKCYYGHIHGNNIRTSFNGEYKGISFRLISCDALSFIPLLVR